MKAKMCPNCEAVLGFKRSIGIGTLILVLITGGLWLIAIPFYPLRCTKCGLSEAQLGEM